MQRAANELRQNLCDLRQTVQHFRLARPSRGAKVWNPGVCDVGSNDLGEPRMLIHLATMGRQAASRGGVAFSQPESCYPFHSYRGPD